MCVGVLGSLFVLLRPVTTLRSPRTMGLRDFSDDFNGSPDFFRPTFATETETDRGCRMWSEVARSGDGRGFSAREDVDARGVESSSSAGNGTRDASFSTLFLSVAGVGVDCSGGIMTPAKLPRW